MMKQLLKDLDGLADEKRIHDIVAEHLSSFGEVVGLKVFDLPIHNS